MNTLKEEDNIELKKLKNIINELNETRIVTPAMLEEFLEYILEYSKYCIPEMQEAWQIDIKRLLSAILDNDTLIDYLAYYVYTAELMQIYANTHSYKDLKDTLYNQKHTGLSFSGTSSLIIKYAIFGKDFINSFDPTRPKKEKNNFLESRNYNNYLIRKRYR